MVIKGAFLVWCIWMIIRLIKLILDLVVEGVDNKFEDVKRKKLDAVSRYRKVSIKPTVVTDNSTTENKHGFREWLDEVITVLGERKKKKI